MVKRVIRACSVTLAVTASAYAQTPIPAGPEFRANAYTTGNQGPSRIAVQPNGDFVVVWTSRDQDGSGDGVFARRFFADGSPRGAEFRVNTFTTGHQRIPSVAVGASGAFEVVWASTHGGTYHNVHGQRYDAAGSPVGVEFQVNTYTPLDQSWPQLARAADGRFVVVWLTVGQDGWGWGLAARRFDPSGNPLGSDFLVNTYTTGHQWEHSVASDANGNFVVVWRDEAPGRDGSGWGVFGQRFDAAGNRLGGDFVVNTYTFQDQFAPNVARNPGGSFVVAFGSRYYNADQDVVRARRFDAAGNGIGSEFQVNTYTTGRQFLFDFGGAVALDGAGNFVVTWLNAPDWMVDPGDILGQRFDASGNKMGGEFAVNQSTVGWQDAPTVGSDAAGNFVVTWLDRDDHDGSGWGAFARRFYATEIQPAALTVDSGGNRVLEPGETVDLRPAWRNVTGAAQTFGGALSNFTGPAGPTYTITDAAGDYGTVAAGATAPCIDCYAVSVSDPPARPASHWDAFVLETTSPVVAEKWWTIHVGRSFTDVSTTSPFYPFIETLLHHGITAGCIFGKRNTFCPAAPVTREQMAPLLLLAKEGAGYLPAPCGEPPMFPDVPVSSWFCRWIEELARRGVVGGCGGGNYCPSHPVTREWMAIFVLRTLDPALVPPACVPPNIYNDVPESSPFCRWIEELANRGAYADCGGGNYCPTLATTREQMSVFLSAPFGLMLYGP